ncbi:transmembrane protein, putative [Bodo saltans]|uniref:Transmembrane protein, putative n=1 Tax=Bodo saltans TaxID=75058 RepID=A0A0S4JBI0_BODSA|nr:transmembrane protein, putative [Bodo saltans]|eukprot:CUG88749.1 transmembrane protein, putative [Bodo saltans]
MYTTFVSNILNYNQHFRKAASASQPPPQLPHLSTIAIIAVVLASLVACTAAVPIQPTFNAANQSTISAAGTYLVDGLAVYTNGTRIFPNLTQAYSLTINAQGTVSLTVQGGILLDVFATRASPKVDVSITNNASLSVGTLLYGLNITSTTSVVIDNSTVDSRSAVVFIRNSSSVIVTIRNASTVDAGAVVMADNCSIANTMISDSRVLAREISSLGNVNAAAITIRSSDITAYWYLIDSQRSGQVTLSILKGTVLTGAGGLYIPYSSGAASVTVDNSTIAAYNNF